MGLSEKSRAGEFKRKPIIAIAAGPVVRIRFPPETWLGLSPFAKERKRASGAAHADR